MDHGRAPSACTRCEQLIRDRTIVVVGSKDYYHPSCLTCTTCEQTLANFSTCHVKESTVLCSTCFSVDCAGCDRQIRLTDWVRRARNTLYHLACFNCHRCKRQLCTGDEFSFVEDKLVCICCLGKTKDRIPRYRTTFTEEQKATLQAHFHINSNPVGANLDSIATLLGLARRTVQIWFQNTRAEQRKFKPEGMNVQSTSSYHDPYSTS